MAAGIDRALTTPPAAVPVMRAAARARVLAGHTYDRRAALLERVLADALAQAAA